MTIVQRSIALAALVAFALGIIAEPPPSFVLIITDDAMGQWTNRYTTEFSHRFEIKDREKWIDNGLSWENG